MNLLCQRWNDLVLLNLHQDFMMEKNCYLYNNGCFFIKITGEEKEI